MSRDRIFAAAKTVLEQEGAAGLTVRKVAQQAKMSPMAMYRHFADKDSLLNALVDDGLAAWEKIARAIRTHDPVRWIEQLGEAYLSFALNDPNLFDAAFFLPASEARRYPDDFAAKRSPVVAMLMARIDEAKAAGKLVDRPALDIALAIAAMSQGMVSMHRAKRFASDAQFKSLYRTAMRQCLQSFLVE